ncbi:MAG: DEAD/DEAH box helicase [Desulfobacterales bacterium]|nr:DEAD/DEAH box helicase [Desulfobacterales bacterium]
MTHAFTALGLRPELAQTLIEKGYTTPTPIQTSIIPALLAGGDVIGQSQTGSGKTAAFALPILQNLIPKQRHVQALVLAPTRELALQVTTAIEQYGRAVGVRTLAVYGGQPYSEQINRLRKGVDVVVGTPGRLLDLIEKKALDLQSVDCVILDEADEMLSMGFIADIETILKETPEDRQTGLFSATLPQPIRTLAQRYLRKPQAFTMGGQQRTVDTVEQRYYLINEADRLAALTRLFEVEPIVSALVFARTRLGTGDLVNELVGRGFTAELLNGDLSQEARERVLQRFRNNQIKVLVATDVAARGLDIDHVTHVFNYDLPNDPEVYVHRIGRTGRAGKSGIAISLLTPKERWFLRRIEAYTKQKMTLAQLPTEAQIQEQRDSQLVEQMLVWLRRGRCQHERDLVQTLAAQGHEVAEIAAAALKLIRADEKQRPIAPISEVREERAKRGPAVVHRTPRGKSKGGDSRVSHEEGMVRLALSSGKADGLSVSHIVGSLAHHADIPGNCIGKIRIEDQAAYVDVPEAVVAQVLAKTGSYQIGRRRITVQRA